MDVRSIRRDLSQPHHGTNGNGVAPVQPRPVENIKVQIAVKKHLFQGAPGGPMADIGEVGDHCTCHASTPTGAFTLPPLTLAAATLLAGCCHPSRPSQSTLGDLPPCQLWSIRDHARPAQSCRHSCGQLGGWPSFHRQSRQSAQLQHTACLPVHLLSVCFAHLHFTLSVCLCLSVSDLSGYPIL